MDAVDFNELTVPSCVSVQRVVQTQHNISAIRIERDGNGEARLGGLEEIPCGATLEVCGEGFNSRTIKARYDQNFFFVYLQDIELPTAPVPQ